MTTKLCPYCNSAQSILMGNVYCSHSSDDMHKLENGSMMLKLNKLEETAEHTSRLTIRLTLNGEQHYKIGNHDHLINANKYLVINQGQSYKTSFEGTDNQEMVLVAFKPAFVAGVLKSILTPEIDKLNSTKLSTRTELYRRLYIAKDYMDAHPDKRISIDEVARVAFLSTHHFKRAFKELFETTPHQYHVVKRLERS